MIDPELAGRIREREWDSIGRLTAPEGYLYAGLPWFKGLWGRDSLIAAWQLLQLDPSIAGRTLEFLAGRQGRKSSRLTEEDPGRILHMYDYEPNNAAIYLLRLGHRLARALPYYGCVDATPLFVIVAGEYFEATGDGQLIEEIWPNIEKATDWLVKYGDLDGDAFIEYKRKTPLGVRNQNWKDSLPYMHMKLPVAVVEVQGYAYDAFRKAARMGAELGKECHDWEERADRLKKELNERFWMEDSGFFAMALDGKKRQVTDIASNAGHLLFTGIVDKEKEGRVVDRLFEEDMFTPYGIRCHSSSSPHFDRTIPHLGQVWPHECWIIRVGLDRLGYADKARLIDDAILRTYEELGRLPEFVDIANGKAVIGTSYKKAFRWRIPFRKACEPQAWASGAILSIVDGMAKGN
jgi:glycogen debranching enzyme